MKPNRTTGHWDIGKSWRIGAGTACPRMVRPHALPPGTSRPRPSPNVVRSGSGKLFVLLLLALCLCSEHLSGAVPQLITKRDSSLPQDMGANGDSVAPWLSPDGRFVVYSSNAGNLVTNDNHLLSVDAFLLDRDRNRTTLVSMNQWGTGGGNGHSSAISVSTNGRFVLFESAASNLVSIDTNQWNQWRDIFVRDVWSNTTQLASVAANGGVANGDSSSPVMTPDGRYVAFISKGTNLVANDTNKVADLFVRDLVNQTTVLASVGATGANAVVTSPALTPDGRWLAFFSTARGLVSGVTNVSQGEIYLRDLVGGTTFWPSTNAISLVQQSLPFTSSVPVPSHPVVSADGRYVAFKVGWTNGTSAPPPGTTAATLVLRYDTVANLTTIISTNGYPTPAYDLDEMFGPEMTPDGRFVAFVGRELVGSSIYSSIQLWDAQTGTTSLVSAGPSGPVPEASVSCAPRLSDDGRFLAFLSNATNLVSNPVASGSHIYFRDMQAPAAVLVDADTNGVANTDEAGTVPSLSADGALLAYCGPDADLVGAEANGTQDVFLWHAATATNELLSRRDPFLVTATGNNLGAVSQLCLSEDGRRVVYASYASDLMGSDSNRQSDIFVWDACSGTNALVSVGFNGGPALGGCSHTPAISGNGRFVSFVSTATNLVAVDTNGGAPDIFLRDLQTQTTTLQSVDTDGRSLGGGGASGSTLSWDGRYLAFISRPALGSSGIYWRDTVLGVTRLLASYSSTDATVVAPPPSLTADGQRVAYIDSAKHLLVWDASTLETLYTNVLSVSSAAISPNGNWLLYQASGQVVCYDLAGRSNLFVYPSSVPLPSSSPWSRDDRFVAFASDLLAGGSARLTNVFLYDLQTHTRTLVSASTNGTNTGGNNNSDAPVLSGDGRCVAFRSSATDLLVDGITTPGIFRFDRLTQTTQRLTPACALPCWSTWASPPRINDAGDTVVFQSSVPLVTQGDLNRLPDLALATTVLRPLPDSDGDGIPDWWLQDYFGHTTGLAADQSRAADDADGDGQSNYQEYLAGTVPTDAASVFRLQLWPAGGSATGLTLTWTAAPGRSYQVQSAMDLNAPDWQPEASTAQVMGSQGFANVTTTDSMRFFRVVSSLTPPVQ